MQSNSVDQSEWIPKRAYTELLATIDDVVEEGIASAVVLWEAYVFLRPPRLPDHLKSPNHLSTTPERSIFYYKRAWVSGEWPRRVSDHWALRTPYARRLGRRSGWRAPSSFRRGRAIWEKNKITPFNHCYSIIYNRDMWGEFQVAHMDRWSSDTVFKGER